jgi:hypothetical protein
MFVAGAGIAAGVRATRSPAPTSVPATDGDACATVPARLSCRTVTVEGRTFRYSLVGGDPASGNGVLLDPGGPGLAVLSGQHGLSALVEQHPQVTAWGAAYVLEEPWVTAPVEPGCRNALRAFYSAARLNGDADATAAALVRDCDLALPGRFGHGRELFRAAVAAIETAEGVTISTFVGASFGVVRASYIADMLTRTLLLRPYPLGAPPADVLTERAERAWLRLPDTTNVVPVPDLGVEVPDRSLPVTPFDWYSAVLSAAYVDDPSQLESLRSGDPAAIGHLSDGLWQRYGQTDLSPGYLAYLSEVCPTATGWPDPATMTDPAARVLATAHLPCRHLPSATPQPLDVDCVVIDHDDPIAPPGLLDTIRERATTVVNVATGQHHSLEGFDECLRTLQAP